METDDNGGFAFEDLDPGRYSLLAQRPGFAHRMYGGRGSMFSGASLSVSPGQALTGIEFKLVPHGVIAGRVLDEEGEPLANVIVMALQPMYRRGERR